MPLVIVVSVLKNFGLNMTIFLSALISVPQMYYEAAVIDGASKKKQFFHITIPMITPTIFVVVMMTAIASLKVFAQIYVMTAGGPGDRTKVIVYYIYEMAFKSYKMGYASANKKEFSEYINDIDILDRAPRLSAGGFGRLLKEAQKCGEINFKRERVLIFETNNPGEVIINTTRITDHTLFLTDVWLMKRLGT